MRVVVGTTGGWDTFVQRVRTPGCLASRRPARTRGTRRAPPAEHARPAAVRRPKRSLALAGTCLPRPPDQSPQWPDPAHHALNNCRPTMAGRHVTHASNCISRPPDTDGLGTVWKRRGVGDGVITGGDAPSNFPACRKILTPGQSRIKFQVATARGQQHEMDG